MKQALMIAAATVILLKAVEFAQAKMAAKA
jgi:hypothetical protein